MTALAVAMPSKERAVPAVAVLAMLFSLVSCVNGNGGEERNYATPRKLCGVEIDPRLLEPLLPGGNTVSAESWTRLPSCEIKIDSRRHGSMVIYTSDEPWEPGDHARRARNLESGQVSEWDVEDGGAIWLGDALSGSEIAFICPYDDPGRSYGLFDFDIGDAGQIGDEGERARRIKEFSLNYLEGIKRSLCDT